MPTRRFEKLEPERKRVILDTAQLEFTNHGFRGASLNRIISGAGISKGSFYYYFEDKADLYVTALERVMKEIMDRIGGIFNGEYSDDYWVDIESMISESMAILRDDPAILRFVRGMYSLSTNYANPPIFQQYVEKMGGVYTGILKHGQAMGAIRSDLPIDMLVNIISAIDEGLDRWILERFESFSEQDVTWIVACYIDLMKRVAAPEPEIKEGT